MPLHRVPLNGVATVATYPFSLFSDFRAIVDLRSDPQNSMNALNDADGIDLNGNSTYSTLRQTTVHFLS